MALTSKEHKETFQYLENAKEAITGLNDAGLSPDLAHALENICDALHNLIYGMEYVREERYED